ncbi:DUF3618 domain-containing protein [Hydrocarboniclastica marina]|uniref:DUF3618 domain-containing protein n=1 Tax=Hydrocarboniclastica marina TaxID=2259620 RepID=A0A4P7XE90_9ALTE|nr:DUF3618 domain-containing protein [Hydrocarboniclastica marina]MAL99835.1 hypothetical protein [Alteromonadaceae bacterium]QCF25201.1 DUF3618 domain-containing protein [Hydrocarboniclastica marina]|tara:strand:+ start:688 stop:1686 length:999 start_codon:yes stop_codon:yes gene_type:complete
MSHQDENSPEYLEQQIEQTRSQLSDTLNELQSRLSPSDLFEEALTYAKSHREFGQSIATTVRENPIPICLMGIGLTWLITSGASGPRHRLGHSGSDSFDSAPLAGDPRFSDHPEGPTPQPYPAGDGSSRVGGAKQKLSDAKAQASEKASSVKDKMQDAKSQLGQKAESATNSISHSGNGSQHKGKDMNERYQNMRNKGSEVARNMQEGYHQRTHEIRHRANSLIEERPLAVAAIGFGIGAAIGLLMPSTEREDRLMGSTRDHLKHRAMEEGEQQFEQARSQVEKTAEAVNERVQEEAKNREASGSKGGSQASPAGKAGTSSASTAGTPNRSV